jgi:cytochrome c
MRKLLMLASTAAVLLEAGSVASAADAGRGKELFATCAACHSDKPDAIGPTLQGVYGRKSGSIADFRYSTAMKRANLTWDESNLRDYIKEKGNRMPFGGLSDSDDVNDIVAYLKSL